MKQAKRILLITPYGSYRTAAYVTVTGQLGFDCIIASTGYHAVSHAPGSTIISLEGGSTNLDLGRLQKQHRRTPFQGVIATDDSVVEIAAAVIVLVAYAQLLPELGFVISTAVAAAFLSWRLGAGSTSRPDGV